MDVIQAARELGKAIQADDRYAAMQAAQQRSEEDTALQGMISQFNMIRMQLNGETKKPERDQNKIRELDAQINDLYAEIYRNDNMLALNETRGEMQTMISFITQIIQGSTEGMDPEKIEYQESCGGDCGGCAGCS